MELKVCALCGSVGKLIGQSHIIPKFMYKGMADPKNRMKLTSSVNNKITEKIINNPFYDKDILCRTCENERLAKIEKYADRVFYTERPPLDAFKINFKMNQESIRYLHLENVNYIKFKLFLLSVLWRAHISSNPFFKQIKLGPLADKLKTMILAEDPGPETFCKIFIFGLQKSPNTFYKVVGNPKAVIGDGLEMYSFLINGFGYNFILKDDNGAINMGDCNLKSTNEIAIPLFDGRDAVEYLSVFCGMNTVFSR